MDRRQRSMPLGSLALAVVLTGTMLPSTFGGTGARMSFEPNPTSLDVSSIRAPLVTRVTLGELIPADCDDPAAWRVIPGVGPTLSRALAERAAVRPLSGPEDLLPIRGLGVKMATKIGPWIRWPTTPRPEVSNRTVAPPESGMP